MTKIQYQKQLMQQALIKLSQIDLARELHKQIDPLFYKVISANLKMEYADIMAALKMELDSINQYIGHPITFRKYNFSKN